MGSTVASADRFWARRSLRVSSESDVATYRALDKLIVGDARRMDEVSDSSVALVVTSPPDFAGKEYEETLGEAAKAAYPPPISNTSICSAMSLPSV